MLNGALCTLLFIPICVGSAKLSIGKNTSPSVTSWQQQERHNRQGMCTTSTLHPKCTFHMGAAVDNVVGSKEPFNSSYLVSQRLRSLAGVLSLKVDTLFVVGP